MRAIVIAVVAWTLGLAVLLGSPAVTLALSKYAAGKTYCLCTCYNANNHQRADLGWEKVGACGLADGKNCSFTGDGGLKVSGKLQDCWQCTGDANGVCSASGKSSVLSSGMGVPPAATLGQPGTTTVPTAPVRPVAPFVPVAPAAPAQ